MAGGKFKKILRKVAPIAGLAASFIPGIGPIAGKVISGIGSLAGASAARDDAKKAAAQPGIAGLMGGMSGGVPEAAPVATPSAYNPVSTSVNPYAAEGPASSYAAAPQGLRSLQPSQLDYGQNEQAMFNAPQQEPAPAPEPYAYGGPIYLAHGGIAGLQPHEYKAGGQYLSGPGDGMSDNIVANIEGRQEARLSDSEFVIPADVVSHLGNGSSDAGARKLHAMMDRIRMARTGTKKQGKKINPEKYLPA